MGEFSNNRFIRQLEAFGAETCLSDISEWVWYCNVDQEEALRHAGQQFSGAMLGARLRDHIQRADEKAAHRSPVTFGGTRSPGMFTRPFSPANRTYPNLGPQVRWCSRRARWTISFGGAWMG